MSATSPTPAPSAKRVASVEFTGTEILMDLLATYSSAQLMELFEKPNKLPVAHVTGHVRPA